MSVLAAVLGLLAVIVAGVVGYIIAKKGADRGMLAQYKVWNPHWIPLTVLLDDEGFPNGQLTEAVKEAIKFWNGEVGFELFKELGDVSRAGFITISKGEFGISAKLTFDTVGMITAAHVSVSANDFLILDENHRWVAIAHELGHCMGLDHDATPISVMYPKLKDVRPCVTDGDIILLRKVYRPISG